MLFQFQIKDDIKAARIEAARRTNLYVELPKTSQRREGLDMELVLGIPGCSAYYQESAAMEIAI
jgi:hypothetical protein